MSVTSMNSRMAMAEKLSIPQLQQAIKSGSVPAYVGIPLLQEKMKMQQAMQSQEGQPEAQGTLADQVMQAADVQGITQLPSNLPTMDEAQMGMAGGGIVAFAGEEGSYVADPEASNVTTEEYTYSADATPTAPAAKPTYAAPRSIAPGLPSPELSPETQALFSEYGGLLRAQRADAPQERQKALYMSLIQGGLAAAGGVSPNALQNIAQGAMVGAQNYQKSMEGLKKEERESLKQLLDMGLSKEKFLQEAQKMGVDVYKANKIYDAQIYAADATVRAAGIRANAEKQPRAITQAELDQQQIDRAARILMNKNPGMSEDEAKSEATQNLLKIKHPDPSNLTGVGSLVAAENSAVVNDPAVIAAAQDLKMATLAKDEKAIEAANIKLRKATDVAKENFRDRVAYVTGSVSNRPAGGANPPPTGTTPPPAPVRQPLPMPKTRDELKTGEVYNTARGPAKWDGTKFVSVK